MPARGSRIGAHDGSGRFDHGRTYADGGAATTQGQHSLVPGVCSARYDRVLDNVATFPPARVRGVLTPDGRLLSNGAPVGGWFGDLGNVARALATSLVDNQQARPFVSTSTGADSRELASMVERGELRPLIDQTSSLDHGPQAFAHVATGHAQGKTVVSI